MQKDSKIYIAGHRGLVGSALVRELLAQGYTNLVYRTHAQMDLQNQAAVEEFFACERPEYVFLAAAKVGGILANSTYPADFIYSNLSIQNNIISLAHKYQVKKLLFLGSSCIYPKNCPQPIKEEYLLTGELEPTNDAYAIAKIAGIKMCQAYNKQYGTDFISVMPTNLYGPNDNFDLNSSHVLPALMRKFHEAKVNKQAKVVVWGTGKPIREFLYADDLAAACVYLMNSYSGDKIVNIGTGIGITIKELAEAMAKVVGFEGQLEFDTTKPDGTMVKINDVSYLKTLGWQAKIELTTGLQMAYKWYLENVDEAN